MIILYLKVCDIWQAFQLDNSKFHIKYGIEKELLKSKKIVLHCLKGKRAFDAADKLALLGYDDVYVYKVFCYLTMSIKYYALFIDTFFLKLYVINLPF